MSLQTPTTADIANNMVAQLEATLNQSIPLLVRAFNRVLPKVMAGVFILLYKYGGFMFLQMFVSKASNEATEVNGITLIPLQEWGKLIGVGLPRAATNAVLNIEITVLNQVGSLNQGTQLIQSDTGVVYITTNTVALSNPTVNVNVRAVADQQDGGGAGTIGNAPVGATLTFVSPESNVVRETTVASQVTTGTNPESTANYRQRVIDEFQKIPQGGAYRDYEIWAEEVPGIINAYPYTSECPGQINVYTEATVESSGNPDGIPTQPQLDEVSASIELDQDGLATRRPGGAFVNSFPITRVGFDVVVIGIDDVADLAQVQADITQALLDYYASVEPFIVGLTIPPRNDYISRATQLGIVDDIVKAANGFFANVTFSLTNVDQDLYFLQEGEKAKTLSITYEGPGA